MPKTTFLERRIGVEADVDLGDGMIANDRLVPHLGYPVEMFSVSNRRLPKTMPMDNPDAFPRVALLDPEAFLLWVVGGDYGYDRNGGARLTRPGDATTDDEIRARPVRGSVDRVTPLSSRDRGFNFTPKVFVWTRIFDVSPQHYVALYGFAGRKPRDSDPPAQLASLVGSLKFRDYS